MNTEKTILSILLKYPEAIYEVMDKLRPDHFSDFDTRQIYTKMLELEKQKKPIIPEYLTEEHLSDCIEELSNTGTPEKKYLDEYVVIIIDAQKKLILKSILMDIGAELQDISLPCDEIVRDLNSKLIRIEEDKVEKKDFLKFIEQRMQNPDKHGISSGMSMLDRTIHGFQKNNLYIVAGRTGMGKSSFLTSVVANILFKHKSMIFSLEMPEEETKARIYSALLGIPNIYQGELTAEQFYKIMDAEKQAKVIIDDKAGCNLSYIKSKTIIAKKKHGVDIVFVDHLGITGKNDNKMTKLDSFEETVKGLKILAKELEIPVVALAQINRGVEQRTNRRPLISDLRDCGEFEQSADVIIMLYREEYYLQQLRPDEIDADYTEKLANARGKIELNIGKNRGGITDNLTLSFDPAITKIYERIM